MSFRNYRAPDRAACISLFDSNVPLYFAAGERADFTGFLDDLPGPYLVMEDGGRIVACGGWARQQPDAPAVTLCWGMVDRACHRRGLGRQLLEARLARIAADKPAAAEVLLSTSQHSAGFFARYGFEVCKVVPEGYGSGIDRCDMRLEMAPNPRRP
jgi:predicted GNAT family N-acyltransferase